MADIQSVAAEIRRGKKRRRKKKKNKPQHENIMVSLLHRATIKKNKLQHENIMPPEHTTHKLTKISKQQSSSRATNDMMIALSMEKLSVGRPALFQLRICTGSPSVLISEKSSEHGIPLSRVASIQICI